MIDLDILKECGISAETLKKTFSLQKQEDAKATWTQMLENGDESQKQKVGRLLKRIESRIRQGRDYGIQHYRVYEAIDDAWNAPLNQVTPSMLWSLIDKNVSPEAAMEKLKSWGIRAEDYIREIPDPKMPEKSQRVVEIPAFIQPRVSLAKNYTEIRWATMTNERKAVPFFKYEPAISNQVTQMRCEVITARVEEMANQYNYRELDKQMRLRLLKYGTQFSFPSECWSWEEQLVEPDSGYAGVEKNDGLERTEYENASDEASAAGETYTGTASVDGVVDLTEKKKRYVEAVVKEGVNYHLPHPARTYRDQAHWASSFNTDSGGRFAGYWKVMRIKELRECRNYWNLDKIRISTGTDWYTPGRGIFENVYPCAMTFPSCAGQASGGVGEKDGERIIGDGYYTSTMEDEGVLVHNYFEKLNPKENGIGDYDYDVWFRFVLAGDGTVIYCEALPYCPVGYVGYDSDESNVVQSSMVLEIIPWETQLTNLFSQYIMSVIQNCYNITQVDTDVVDMATINNLGKIPNLGNLTAVLKFSGKELEKRQVNARALYSERLPVLNTQEIAQAMKTVLELCERLLVMSPQEMGQAASHEQTREEVRVVSQSSSSRLEFTGAAMEPWTERIKRINYEGLMAYGQDEFYAQIPSDPEFQGDEGKAALEALGFTYEGMEKETGRMTVGASLSRLKKMRGGKTAIPYDKFVANRDARDRVNEREEAQAQTAFIDRVLSNPMLMQATGPDQGIAMMNRVARGLGFPRDFKLVNAMNDKQMLQQNNEELMQAVQQMLEQSNQQMGEQIKQIIDLVGKKNQEQDEAINALTGSALRQASPVTEMRGMNSMPGMAEMNGMPPNGMESAMMT